MHAPPRLVVYALGGGLGHAVRGLALARRAVQSQPSLRCRLLINSPFASALAEEFTRSPWLSVRILPATTTPADACAALEEELRPTPPETLAVDCFPWGVAGELRELLPRLRLIHRVLVARALHASPLLAPCRDFARQHYDEIVLAGESTPFDDLPQAHWSPPLLLSSPSDLLPPAAAAVQLDLPPHERCVLMVASGSPAECRLFASAACELAASWPAEAPPLRLALPPGIEFSPPPTSPALVSQEPAAPTAVAALVAAVRTELAARWPSAVRAPPETAPHQETPPAAASLRVVRLFPLAPCLSAAALVVGAAGYHLWHEVQQAGAPALWLPQPRAFDPQAARAAGQLTSTAASAKSAGGAAAVATARRSPASPAPAG